MNSESQRNIERLNLRLKSNAKLLLERAASFQGQTVSKFVLDSALQRAEQTIQEHEVMSLASQDAEAFFNALEAPVHFNQALSDALKEHDDRVISK